MIHHFHIVLLLLYFNYHSMESTRYFLTSDEKKINIELLNEAKIKELGKLDDRYIFGRDIQIP